MIHRGWVIALFSIMLLIAPATASSARQTIEFDATITGVIDPMESGPGGRCINTSTYNGTAVVSAPLRGLKLAHVRYWDGCVPYDWSPTFIAQQQRGLSVQLTTADGERLFLSEDVEWPTEMEDGILAPTPTRTWSVYQAASTGGYAKYVGSGTYEWISAVHSRPTGVLRLTGTLVRSK
jgi:hypothetical protein